MSKGLRDFLLVAGGLFLLRLFFGFVQFPSGVATVLSVLNAALFVGAPVYAMYRAASHKWERTPILVFVAIGVVLHVGGALLARYASGPGNPGEVVYMALVQTGILCWTLGIGALLSLAIKDKNLMIPVAIFLVGFDMFLVFNPNSTTRQFLENAPAVTQNVLATVPEAKVAGEAKEGVRDLAQVGPADLLFAATFFILLFRFEMNARKTLLWMAPVLVLYLLTVVYFGGVDIGPLSLAMLPAMVPIGLTVLLVNRRYFKLQGQELAGVILVTLLSVGLAWFGVYRAKQARTLPDMPVEPSPSVDDRSAPVLEGSPLPER